MAALAPSISRAQSIGLHPSGVNFSIGTRDIDGGHIWMRIHESPLFRFNSFKIINGGHIWMRIHEYLLFRFNSFKVIGFSHLYYWQVGSLCWLAHRERIYGENRKSQYKQREGTLTAPIGPPTIPIDGKFKFRNALVKVIFEATIAGCFWRSFKGRQLLPSFPFPIPTDASATRRRSKTRLR